MRGEVEKDDGDRDRGQDVMGGVGGGGEEGVLETLRALVEGKYVVGLEEEREEKMCDPEIRKRRDEAIAN